MVSKKGTKEPKKEIRELNNSTKDDKKSSLKKEQQNNKRVENTKTKRVKTWCIKRDKK
jgi:hypothetical protein